MTSSSQQLVYETILKYKGTSFADRWLADYENGITSTPEVPVTPPQPTPTPTPQPSEPPCYADALEQARTLLEPRRTSLGNAYPAVLALTCAALEHGHQPEDDASCNNFYLFMTYETLAVLAARAVGREVPYTRRTIERWLSSTAIHAHAVRSVIGARVWYTDTLINYSTGESQGPVIGGTVFRVFLRPLDSQQVRVEGNIMRHHWRDLELDRHAGKTQYNRATLPSLTNVGIDKSSKDVSKVFNLVYLLPPNTSRDSNLINQQYYIYPDMRQKHAVDALRADVQTTATYLASKLAPWLITQQGEIVESVRNRYLEAIWVAVKADMIGGTRLGFELLKQTIALADEVYSAPHTLKNPDAYLWRVLAQRGFDELRRDYGGQRVMSKRMFEQLTQDG